MAAMLPQAPRGDERDRGSPNITHAMETLEMKKKIAMALLIDQEEEEDEAEAEAEAGRLESMVLMLQKLELEQTLLVFSP